VIDVGKENPKQTSIVEKSREAVANIEATGITTMIAATMDTIRFIRDRNACTNRC
jgi:hypothetical protein